MVFLKNMITLIVLLITANHRHITLRDINPKSQKSQVIFA